MLVVNRTVYQFSGDYMQTELNRTVYQLRGDYMQTVLVVNGTVY